MEQIPVDYFRDDNNCINRLFDEWKRYGNLIIAFDFDNTVFDYYKKGYTYYEVIDLIRKCYDMGFHLTVFTSDDESRFPEIEEYLKKNNVPYDSINTTPDFIPFKGRKVYYNHLLDDRAGLSSAYYILMETIQKIRLYKKELAQHNKQDIDF
jgi:hypothetical protein